LLIAYLAISNEPTFLSLDLLIVRCKAGIIDDTVRYVRTDWTSSHNEPRKPRYINET